MVHGHGAVAQRERRREHTHRQEHEDDGRARTRNAAQRARARRVTHKHVSLRGDGHRQPGGDADGHIEKVVRVRIHVVERAITGLRVDVDEERHDRVERVVRQFDCVGHRQADEERVCRCRHLAAAQHDDAEDVSGEAE